MLSKMSWYTSDTTQPQTRDPNLSSRPDHACLPQDDCIAATPCRHRAPPHHPAVQRH
jgi:hypothetical protein